MWRCLNLVFLSQRPKHRPGAGSWLLWHKLRNPQNSLHEFLRRSHIRERELT